MMSTWELNSLARTYSSIVLLIFTIIFDNIWIALVISICSYPICKIIAKRALKRKNKKF